MTRSKVYLIIQAVLCVLVTALLCFSVVHLYQEGLAQRASTNALAWLFTPERIAGQFARIALPFFGSIGFMIAGLVLGMKDPAADTPVNDIECTKDLLASQVKEPADDILKERSLQKKYLAAGWILFGLCMIPVLIYVVNPAHFPADGLEQMFSSLLLGILPWTFLGLAIVLFFSFLRSRSMGREVALLKECAAGKKKEAAATTAEAAAETEAATTAEAAATAETTAAADASAQADVSIALSQSAASDNVPDGRKKSRLVMWVRIVLLAAAVAMIIAGALNGSLRDVLIKAINLCTECVGLG